jgi:hypothetical protein
VNVDTADLGDLVAQVAELASQVAATGRKVSCLTGRVTVMSAVLGRVDRGITALAHLTEFGLMVGRARTPARPVPRHARPRHLKAVGGGGS